MINSGLKAEIMTFVKYYDSHGKAVGVVLQGGYARGTAARTSDIDLVFLFTDQIAAAGLEIGSFQFKDYSYDVRHCYLDNLVVEQWPSKVRYIYSEETVILYDQLGAVAKVVEKSKMTALEQKQVAVYAIKKLSIRGVTYQGYFNCQWRGLNLDISRDYWIEKGDLISAHMRLNECLELIAMLLFALNGSFLPSPKWRYNRMQNLKWLPARFSQLWASSLEIVMDVESHNKRHSAFCHLLTACIEQADSVGLLPEDIRLFYREYFFKLTDNPTEVVLGNKVRIGCDSWSSFKINKKSL